jgi:hypothetical protein
MIYFLAFLVAIFALFHLVVLVLLLRRTGKKPKDIGRELLPVFNYNNLQVIVFVLAIVFSVLAIMNTASGSYRMQTWFLGLFTTLFGWINFINLLSKMPLIGVYANIFIDIVLTFLKLVLFAPTGARSNCYNGNDLLRCPSYSKFSHCHS